MSEQLAFWGYDADGLLASTGQRLVYFVECGNFVKIGFTTRDVRERMKEFETGNPQKFNLLGTIVVPEGSDDRALHKRFAMFRHRKEWFRKTPELSLAIERLLHAEVSAHDPQCIEPARIDISHIPIGAEFLAHVACPKCGEWLVAGMMKRIRAGADNYGFGHPACNSKFRVIFHSI